jgi:hypothetical protein
MAQQIQFRRGTSAEWISFNPILAEGEMGIELDTSQFKLGNGVDAWVDLAYGGIAGTGVPLGGTTSQALVKTSDADYATNWATIDKTFVGLSNVDNTSDANKPISVATQTALTNLQTQITNTQPLDDDLTALAGLTTAGILVRTGVGTAATRTIQGSSTIDVANGNAVGGDPVISVKSGSISDVDVATNAGISYSKLESLTPSRVVISNVGGTIVTSNTTATEIGYSQGVTSPIQAQLDAKQPTGSYITALTGDVVGSGPGSATTTIAAGAITNTKVATGAAIDYSKLNLSGNIVNADISPMAAVNYSKLNLASSIVNADVASAAAIAYSKLNLNNSIVNADINASANIGLSKLAVLTALPELYGFPVAGDTLIQALARLVYASSLQYNTITADAVVPSGSTWIRDDVTIDGTADLILEGDGTVSLI